MTEPTTPAVPDAVPASAPPARRRWPAVLLVVLLALAGLAAFVVPKFIHFGSRSKQSEAASNLKSLYSAQRAYFMEKDAYETDLHALGFEPENGNRYAYFLTADGRPWIRETRGKDNPTEPGCSILTEDRTRFTDPSSLVPTRFVDTGCAVTPVLLPDGRRAGLGITGEGKDAVFVGAAVGNVDSDPDLDCWSVATVDRTDREGRLIPAGSSYNESNDIR